MIVVFPVCKKDISLAILHARWLQQMGRKNSRLAVIFAERGCGDIQGYKALLGESFTRVGLIIYEPLPFRWPLVANQVFQKAAHTMSYFCEPWLFMEADAIAMRPDWLDVMEAEYGRGGKPFMGPKVKGMGHFNGTMIYPFNAPELIPEAMRATDQAWDCVAGPEMEGNAHDVSGLIQHVWCVDRGKWLECGSGSEPRNITISEFKKNISPKAVMLHRVKDSSVIDLLMKGKI